MSQSSAGARRAPAKTRRAPERGNQATRGGDKRDRILDAAVRVFARKGFHATRVSEVANIMFGQFTRNFQAQLQQPADAPVAEAEPLSAASVAWAAAKGALHRSS